MDRSSVVFPTILLLLFVISISEIAKVNGVLCERMSQTYSRIVCHNHRCDHKCIAWEKANHGACHLRDWVLSCYCYYDTCADAPPAPPPRAGGAPGGGGGKDGAGKGEGGGKDGGGAPGGGSGKDGAGKGEGGGKDGGGGGTNKPCN